MLGQFTPMSAYYLGNPPPPKTQGDVAAMFAQRYGKYVLQDETIGETTEYTNLLMDVKNGNWTAFGNDASMAIAQWLGMEIGGPFFAAFLQTITSLEIDFNTPDQYPCTIQGCGGSFGGMTECSVTNEFAWDQIGANFEYVPPQGNNADYQLGPGWGAGPAGMLGWGSNWWRQTNTPDPNHPGQFFFDWTDPTMKGGPDSFEWALEQAVLTAWQQWSTPPGICDVIKQVGGDGNINRSYGGGDLANKVWKNLLARLGAIIPPMVVAWNATHTTGTQPQVACGGGICPPGTTPTGNANTCADSNGNIVASVSPIVYCPGPPFPPREISYTVSSYTGGYSWSNDPLQMAFDGLGLLAGIPAGQAISVLINSGPELQPPATVNPSPHLQFGGGTLLPGAIAPGGTPGAGTPATTSKGMSTGGKWLLGLGIAGGIGALALEAYARSHGMTFTQGAKHLWSTTFHRRPRSSLQYSRRRR